MSSCEKTLVTKQNTKMNVKVNLFKFSPYNELSSADPGGAPQERQKARAF